MSCRVFIFSKTKWEEPPRLRHQLAYLFRDIGCEVYFFEKPGIFPNWRNIVPRRGVSRVNGGIIVVSGGIALLHHKLAVGPFRFVNNFFLKAGIFLSFKKIGCWPRRGDICLNFNYEYSFLASFLRGGRVITVINDSHWGKAGALLQYFMKSALRDTVSTSELVLTVSEPLSKEIEDISGCRSVVVYPWVSFDGEPLMPQLNPLPRTINILYWGFLSNKLDFHYLKKLYLYAAAQEFALKFHFVGEFEGRMHGDGVLDFSGFSFYSSMPLDEAIATSGAVAAIMPYVEGDPENDVTTFPNKFPKLVAAGLPVIVAGMPGFGSFPFVLRLRYDVQIDFESMIEFLRLYPCYRSHMRQFVGENNHIARIRQIKELLELN